MAQKHDEDYFTTHHGDMELVYAPGPLGRVDPEAQKRAIEAAGQQAAKERADLAAEVDGRGVDMSGVTKRGNRRFKYSSPHLPEDSSVPSAELRFRIEKSDADQRLVYGWASVAVRKDGSVITDVQGDRIDPTELEKAAQDFVLDYGATGVMHQGREVGFLVESLVVTPEKLAKMGVPNYPRELPQAAWWVGFKIADGNVFAKVKSGQYRMFSIQGRARRVPDNA